MKEVVREYTNLDLGATYFRGSQPIDGIWATADVTISNACVTPAGYGIGDHRMFIVDIVTSSITGSDPPKIQQAKARRLNTKLPGVGERYAKLFENAIEHHRLIDKLQDIHLHGGGKEDSRDKICKVDDEAGQYMSHAERKCHKFKSGRISFSPESVTWIKRKQIYQSLLEYRQGRHKNRGNLKRAARKQQIRKPFSLSIDEITARLKICETQNDYFRVSGDKYRRKHLLNRVEVIGGACARG
jgi:hypothetical protein